MSRDHRKLKVFAEADRLVFRMYAATNDFPPSERYGLQAQLRRAAVSVATNIVEGSARRSAREYVNFLNIAAAGAAEAQYLSSVAVRLSLLKAEAGDDLDEGYDKVCGQLQNLIRALVRNE